MSALLSEAELKAWSGYAQRQKLEAWLRENKISYTYGKGNKLITTAAAVNQALTGVKTANEEKEGFF
ncbi:MAG: hypothetical protein V4493_02820 [Pseudomonadota bacterium]